jgi:hypothetical protein
LLLALLTTLRFILLLLTDEVCLFSWAECMPTMPDSGGAMCGRRTVSGARHVSDIFWHSREEVCPQIESEYGVSIVVGKLGTSALNARLSINGSI